MLDPAAIRAKLSCLQPHGVAGGEPAAVLMGLVERGGELCFLLTRRSESVATHKGQISFPGGVREPGDPNLQETALRETAEEIGVARGQVETLGEFHDYEAVTGHQVRVVVGLVTPSAEYSPHPVEVAYVLEVPIRFFMDNPPRTEFRMVRGHPCEVYFWDFDGEVIWGLTARMIKDFIDFMIR